MAIDYGLMFLEGAETLVNQKINGIQADKTISATIYSCENEKTGYYKLTYQTSHIYAYASDPTTKYGNGTRVYVSVPGGDFTKQKTIVRAIESEGTDYATLVENTESAYEKIGVNFLKCTEEYQLCSYSKINRLVLYDAQKTVDKGIEVDSTAALTYMKNKKATAFVFSASFKTDLNLEQQEVGGNYGLLLTIDYKNKSTGKTKSQTYKLDTTSMTGHPFLLINFTQENIISSFDDEFVKISKIEFFHENFNVSATQTKADLFVKNVEMYAAVALDKSVLESYNVQLDTPQGTFFKDKTPAKLTITARLKQAGVEITDENKIQYFWYKQEAGINSASTYYNTYGGQGWRCLNNSRIVETEGYTIEIAGKKITTTQKEVVWDADSATYKTLTITQDNLIARQQKYKCVVVYDKIKVENEVLLENYDSAFNLIIESKNNITEFHNDDGITDLHCRVFHKGPGEEKEHEITSKSSDFKLNDFIFCWAKEDMYHNMVVLDETTDINELYADAIAKISEYNADKKAFNKKVASGEYESIEVYRDRQKTYSATKRIQDNYYYNLKGEEIQKTADYSCGIYLKEVQKDADGNDVVVKGEYCGTGYITLTNTEMTNTDWTLLMSPSSMMYKYDTEGLAPTENTSKSTAKVIIEPLAFSIVDPEGKILTTKDLSIGSCKVKWTIPLVNTMLQIDSGLVKEDGGSAYSENEDHTECYVTDLLTLPYSIASKYSVRKDNNKVLVTVDYEGISSKQKLTGVVDFTFTKEGGLGTNGTDYSISIRMLGQQESEYSTRTDIPIVECLNDAQGGGPQFQALNFDKSLNGTERLFEVVLWKDGQEIWSGTHCDDGTKTAEGGTISQLKWEFSRYDDQNGYYVFRNTTGLLGTQQVTDNPCNIAKVSLYYTEPNANMETTDFTSSRSLMYTTGVPFVTVVQSMGNSQYHIGLQDGGFWSAVFNNDGAGCYYDSDLPFDIKLFKKESNKVIDVTENENVFYDWKVIPQDETVPNASGLVITSRENQDLAPYQRWVSPANSSDGSILNSAVVCDIRILSDSDLSSLSAAKTAWDNAETRYATAKEEVIKDRSDFNISKSNYLAAWRDYTSIRKELLAKIDDFEEMIEDKAIAPVLDERYRAIQTFINALEDQRKFVIAQVAQYCDPQDIKDRDEAIEKVYIAHEKTYVIQYVNLKNTGIQTDKDHNITNAGPKSIYTVYTNAVKEQTAAKDNVAAKKEAYETKEKQLFKDRKPNLFIHIPIYMTLNRYGNSAINGWDGNGVSINDDGTVLLAPQVGAGYKENDNSFTGLVLGTEKPLDGKNKIGLLAWHRGAQTIFLDAKTGKAEFGKDNEGKILLDPRAKRGLIYAGNYPTQYLPKVVERADGSYAVNNNYPRGLSPQAGASQGMCIDFTTPYIHFGTGYFSVDPTGAITSTRGKIGGWDIADNELRSNNGKVGLRCYNSTDKGSGLAFWAGKDSNPVFSVNYDGYLTSKSGTIANWNINSNAFYTNGAIDDDGNPVPASGHMYFGRKGLYLGANFSVDTSGKVTAKSAEIDGKIDVGVNSTIGPWTVAKNSIWNGKKGLSSSEDGVYLGSDGIALGKNNVFKVSKAGALTASSGTIGGWKITADKLSCSTDSNNIYISPTSGIKMSSKFSVSVDGALKATSATISGSITATSGTIGGCKIEDGTLKIKAANITDLNVSSIVAQQIKGTKLTVDAANITGKLTAKQINADELTVKAANITGTLKADQINASSLTIGGQQITAGTLTKGAFALRYDSGNTGWVDFENVQCVHLRADRITAKTILWTGTDSTKYELNLASGKLIYQQYGAESECSLLKVIINNK